MFPHPNLSQTVLLLVWSVGAVVGGGGHTKGHATPKSGEPREKQTFSVYNLLWLRTIIRHDLRTVNPLCFAAFLSDPLCKKCQAADI